MTDRTRKIYCRTRRCTRTILRSAGDAIIRAQWAKLHLARLTWENGRTYSHPESEEVCRVVALGGNTSKTSYAYTEKHVGPREQVGNKGGTLGNRLRAVLGEKK